MFILDFLKKKKKNSNSKRRFYSIFFVYFNKSFIVHNLFVCNQKKKSKNKNS